MATNQVQPAPAVSGHELRALADNLPYLAWIADADGAIFWYNKAWCDYTGRLPEEALGRGWGSVHHADDLAELTAAWAAALTSGDSVEMTLPLRRHDGVFRPFLTRIVPVRGSSGEIVRWFGTDVDVSEQVENAEKLQTPEDDWRNLFDEMQEGFVVVEIVSNPAGEPIDAIVVKANRQWESQIGALYNHSVGGRIVASGCAGALERVKIYASVVSTGLRREFEVYDRNFGRTYDIRAYRHSPTQCAVLFNDISARKVAEQEARQAQAGLLRVSRLSAMGAMASTLAHELNQPIGAASNFMAAADEHLKRADKVDADLLKRLCRSAIASCQRAGQIIHSMREFTVSGTVTKSPCDIRELINSSIREYFGGGSAAPVAIDVECPSDLPSVECDRIQIIQVLLNLYTNSDQAMTGITPKAIRISASCSSDAIELRLEDKGHGFRDRGYEELFEPFWTTKDVGLGLGLPLCRTIVEAHGGTITAEAAPSGGAAFFIVLPLSASRPVKRTARQRSNPPA
ncbi:MAG: ATP-binding protein [Sphingomicrobium sp.]